ncbi:MAG: FkbM family methyltransferase [Acidobacteriota bacterium]
MKALLWKAITFLPARELTFETRNGKLTFNTHDVVLGKTLFVDREYELDVLELVFSILSELGYSPDPSSSIFLDVGANIGMTTTSVMKRNAFARAFAFEPDPYNYSLLIRNLEQNDLMTRVEAFNFGLSSKAQARELELSTDNFGDHRIRGIEREGFFREDKRKTVHVSVKPLDSVLSDSIARDISLIWVDIQGHEGHFFKGARETLLASCSPVLSEFWPYGLQRSGTGQDEYCRLISELFTHYINLTGGRRGQLEKIASFEHWFSVFRTPREMGSFLFLRR